MAFQIAIHGTQSNIQLEYYDPILLNEPYEVALVTFVSYNSIPNISAKLKNNELHLTREDDAGHVEERHVTIPDGTYEIADLEKAIVHNELAHSTGVTIALNANTMKVRMHCEHMGIDFTRANSIGRVLGFSQSRVLKKGEYGVSDDVVDIFSINTLRIQCNLIRSNVTNANRKDNTLYEFPLNVLPGERIIERPMNLMYYSINTDSINELSITITDQLGNLIDFRGEKVSIILAFRPIQNGYHR